MRYRLAGPLTHETLERVVVPLIERLQKEALRG